jgi:hypothetical protein
VLAAKTLTNVMLYWLIRAAGSAANIYAEVSSAASADAAGADQPGFVAGCRAVGR